LRLLARTVLLSGDKAPSATVNVSDAIPIANAVDFLTLVFLEQLLNWLVVLDGFFCFLKVRSHCVGITIAGINTFRTLGFSYREILPFSYLA
jgi:hypothetical protein